MQTIEMTAKPRQGTGKGAAHKLRSAGQIPAVLYGAGQGALALQLDTKAFTKLFNEGVSGHLVRITIEGSKKQHAALVKAVQREPVRGLIQHVDFHEVALDKPIHTVIPIVLTGEDERLKDGGILQQTLREISIECLPTEIPNSVEVSVAKLEMGDTILIEQIELPDGVTLAGSDPQDVVVSVTAPRVTGTQEAEEEGEVEDEETTDEAEEEATDEE